MQYIKCVLVGDGAVGKSSMIIKYTTRAFPADIPSILEKDYVFVEVDEKTIMLNLWEAIGQDNFDHLRPIAYHKTDVFVLCFSLVNAVSFDRIKTKWIPEICHHCPNTPYILVGMKKDLRDGQINSAVEAVDKIPKEKGEALAKEVGALKYVECSSLMSEGLNSVFHEVITAALQPPEKKSCRIL